MWFWTYPIIITEKFREIEITITECMSQNKRFKQEIGAFSICNIIWTSMERRRKTFLNENTLISKIVIKLNRRPHFHPNMIWKLLKYKIWRGKNKEINKLVKCAIVGTFFYNKFQLETQCQGIVLNEKKIKKKKLRYVCIGVNFIPIGNFLGDFFCFEFCCCRVCVWCWVWSVGQVFPIWIYYEFCVNPPKPFRTVTWSAFGFLFIEMQSVFSSLILYQISDTVQKVTNLIIWCTRMY